jgi:superfamily II DNA helicase RecQ
VDNPSEDRPGYSFIDHEENQWPVDGKKWLFYQVMGDEQRRAEFMPQRPEWKEGRVQEYMQKIRRFKEKLLVLMHITGGQPARAPELLSIRYCNTRNGGRRNIFVEEGKLVFVTAYHKGYQFAGTTKIIHRYIPTEVGELLMYYLWLVMPFQRQLEEAVYHRSFSKGYLWEPGAEDAKWVSERMKKLIQQESLIGMGVKLNISSYRQIAIAITRKYLKGEGFIEDREDEEGLEDGDEEDTPRQKDSAFDLQSGHGTHVAGMIYARAIFEAPGEVASIRQQYRTASEGWHRLLQFASTFRGQKRQRVWEVDDQDCQFQRWKRIRKINVVEQLERIVGPGAKFRGVQEETIKAIMVGKSPILAVMGTGGGKSLLFMLPAACSAAVAVNRNVGMTVVVVPMISLREDLKRRCEQVGIACAEWECRRPRTGVSVMLVTPESAVSKAFQTFLIRVRAAHQLERIVIDECHVVLDSRGDFRPRLRRLGELLVAETQMIMLTATLPPSEEKEFFQQMMMPSGMVTTFRASTSRPNIRYQRITMGNDRNDDANGTVVPLVGQKLGQFPAGKIIVYGASIQRVQEVAAELGCEAYYRDVDDRSEVFQRVVGASCRVVVATNALGLGIDLPDIRVVIHMDPVRSLRDFAQESGRAGRDGGMSESIMMVHRAPVYRNEPTAQLQEGKRCCRVVLDEYLDGRMDRTGCEEGEEMCWVCRRRNGVEAVEEERERSMAVEEEREEAGLTAAEEEDDRVEFQRSEGERQMIREQMQWMRSNDELDIDRFQQELQRWSGKCPYCYMHGEGGRTAEHGLGECIRDGVEGVQELFGQIKRMIRYDRYCVYYDCGIPQAICRRFVANGVGRWKWVRERSCQYPDLMVGVVAAGVATNGNRIGHSVIRWMEEEGVNVEDDVQTVAWMGKKIYWGEMEAAKINKVWYRLVQSIG